VNPHLTPVPGNPVNAAPTPELIVVAKALLREQLIYDGSVVDPDEAETIWAGDEPGDSIERQHYINLAARAQAALMTSCQSAPDPLKDTRRYLLRAVEAIDTLDKDRFFSRPLPGEIDDVVDNIRAAYDALPLPPISDEEDRAGGDPE
jgi:hypothetical protein